MRLPALVAVVLLALAPRPAAASVGFQTLAAPDGAAKPLVIGVWYPSDGAETPQRLGLSDQSVAPAGPVVGDKHPLVIMSHGTGGWFASHVDTALALARAGFIVAAVSHTGDTWEDRTHAADVDTRPAQLRHALDYVLNDWSGRAHIAADRIGVFGFSSGGFTGLVAIGGVPNFSGERAHCQAHPDYFDCGVVRAAPSGHVERIMAIPASDWAAERDPRIKAAVIAAPALGYTFGREGLKDISVPIQLWRAQNDHILPNPEYAEAVRASLPRPAEYHVVANADHYDFLSPCNAQAMKTNADICTSAPGFDRAAFHAEFDAQVVRFFEQTLK